MDLRKLIADAALYVSARGRAGDNEDQAASTRIFGATTHFFGKDACVFNAEKTGEEYFVMPSSFGAAGNKDMPAGGCKPAAS